MFENFGTAIVQAVGFFGVFGFFVYRLLSEKVSTNSPKEIIKNNSSTTVKRISAQKKGLFGRKKKANKTIDDNKKEIRKGWFKR